MEVACNYRSIQIDYRQTLFLRGINFQLQIQNCAAGRINCHYRDRAVEISAEISHYRYRFSPEVQLPSITDTGFGLRFRQASTGHKNPSRPEI